MDRVLAISFTALVLLVAAVGIRGVVTFRSGVESERNLGWVAGEVTQAFDAHYEAELPIRSFATQLWAAIQYGIFREGRPGVVVGHGDAGWLFSSEELLRQVGEDANVERNLETIVQVHRELERRGSHLILLPLPAKARLYADALGPEAGSVARLRRLERLQEHLTARGIPFVDVLPRFEQTKQQTPMFLPTDTHWTPEGARVSADAVADRIAAIDPGFVRSGMLRLIQAPNHRHAGDLMSFIPLGDWFQWLAPAPEHVVGYRLDTPDLDGDAPADAWFADQSFEVVLLGTSYSANQLWCFADCLAAALGTDVLNLATQGRGPIKPVLDYLASDTARATPARFVIWEFPERYLGFDYSGATGQPGAAEASSVEAFVSARSVEI